MLYRLGVRVLIIGLLAGAVLLGRHELVNAEGPKPYISATLRPSAEPMDILNACQQQSQKLDQFTQVFTKRERIDGDLKKTLHCFVDGGEIWYQILYTAQDGSFLEYLPQAKAIINSFKITE